MIFGSSERNLVFISISEAKGLKGRFYSVYTVYKTIVFEI